MVTLVNLRAYWRFLVVVRQFFPLIVAYTRDRRKYVLFGGSRRVDAETRIERAEVLLDSLLTLGPTFIKLGQLLSTRPDILPAEYIDVLSSLQDDVPPAPWTESKVVIEEELGPVDDAFDDFDRDPISGASLGQVYTATYDDEPVAVKVRRPGIEDLVEADLRVIRWSLPIVRRFIGQGRAFSLENLADEFAKTIRQEMDYSREKRILEEIRGNFSDHSDILIPRTIESRSGPRVLTMEYLPGTKINDVETLDRKGIDRTELATTLQRVYLQMIVDDGVFHADPHPGNLAVTDDGRIIFYDFGMSGTVDPFIQEKIIDFYVAVANQDIDAILDTLIEMGTLSPEADRQVMGDVMELAIADARGEDIEQYRVQQIIEQVESTIYEFPLRLPRNLALVLRVATVVEGVCVTLDPDFDFISVATDYLQEEGYYEETARELIREGGQQVRDTSRALFEVPPKLNRTLDRVENENLTVNVRLEDENDVLSRLARRIVYGLFVAVGALSTSILYAFEGTSVIPAAVAAVLTLPPLVALYRSFRQKRGIKAKPQFTRQSMRERREGRE
ncbi:MAG: ABC1 kinase family protein [Halobellus sp.]